MKLSAFVSGDKKREEVNNKRREGTIIRVITPGDKRRQVASGEVRVQEERREKK